MTNSQLLIAILLIAAVTLLLRAIPFLMFSAAKETPKTITYLGKVLPSATIAMLAIYCFKDVNVLQMKELIPAIMATAVVVGLQFWRGKIYLSIIGGTVIYMILVQFVFQ